MTKVKICGLRRVEDAVAAADAGADMLGFVFAQSRRKIEPEAACDIIREVRRRADARMVGIFVNASTAEINGVGRLCDLDLIQLSGDEGTDVLAGLERPIIKTIHVRQDEDAGELLGRALATTADILHFDTAHSAVYGGTGAVFDWARLPVLDRLVVLAGGLHSENVGEAILAVQPWAVDVSSGVETSGEKDHNKIRAFVLAARRSSSS